ncbi:MAG: alpha-2-macroglobulin family protein [Bacteroidota bacterium]
MIIYLSKDENMRGFYTAICLLACLYVCAQEYAYPNDTSFYLAISAAEVLDFGKNYSYRIPERSLNSAAYANDTPEHELPYGHYLYITTHRLEARAKHIQHFPYQVWVGNRGQQIAVGIYDSLGYCMPSAKVQVDGRKLRWHSSDSLFVRRDWNVNNMRVIIAYDTLIYSLRDDQHISRISHGYKRLRRTKAGRIALFPIHILDRTIRYVDRGIGDGNWNWYNSPFSRRSKSIYGYISSSQPSYRPGDTIRVSIYCSTYRGRPIKRAPTVSLMGWQFSKQMEVKTQGRGHYAFETVVDDDWPLDRSINVSVSWPEKAHWRFAQSYNIKIEDYQLDEYKLTIDAPNSIRPAPAGHASAGGEVLEFKVTAEDVNHRPISGGRLKLTLTTEQLIDSDSGHETYLRDTIWTEETVLSSQTESEWIVPDSLLPDSLELKMRLEAELIAAGGERKQATDYIVVDRKNTLEDLTLEYEDEQLIINGPVGVAAIAIYTDQQDERYTLPDTLPLPKEDELIEITSGPLHKAVGKQFIKDLVRSDLGWPGLYLASPQVLGQADSLGYARLFLPSPPLSDLDFRWSVTTPDGRQIATGLAADLPTFLDIDPSDHQLWVNYQRRLSGEWVRSRQALSWTLEKLEIDIAQAEQVQPGQEVEVTVSVHDQEGEPVQGAVLSSGTYNARFDRSPHSSISARTGFSRYEPKFYLSRSFPSEKQLYAGPNLFALAGWQELPIIQLQNPPPTGYVRYRDLPNGSLSEAELAVFVRTNDRFAPIRAIWINDEIKYYDLAWGETDYSIAVDTGIHKIEIRTDDKLFTKQLEAKAGQQIIFSFDSKFATSSGWLEVEMPPFPTAEEWTRISARVNSIRAPNRSYNGQPLWVKGENGQVFYSSNFNQNPLRKFYLGLFDAQDSIDIISAWSDSTRFQFEPGFDHQVSDENHKLYAFGVRRRRRPPQSSSTQSRPGFINYDLPGRISGYFQIIDSLWANRTQLISPSRRSVSIIDSNPNEYRIVAIEGIDTSFLISFTHNRSFQLNPGTYTIRLFDTPGRLIQRQFSINPDDKRKLLSIQSPQWEVLSMTDSLREKYFEWVEVDQFFGRLPYSRAGRVFYGTEQISGHIFDKMSGTSIPFANIEVYNGFGEKIAQIQSDETGYFNVAKFNGKQELIFSSETYLNETFTVNQGQTASNLQIFMQKAPRDFISQNHIGRIGTLSFLEGNLSLAESDETAIRYYLDSLTFPSGIQRYYYQFGAYDAQNHDRYLSIRGSREYNTTYYYVDGIRVQGNLMQDSYSSEVDRTTAGRTVTSSEIRRLPTRNISAFAAQGAGLVLSGEIDGVQILPGSLDEYSTDYLFSASGELPLIRSSFSDMAHYEPYLMTDESGQAHFRIRFPDDITAWNTFAIGQDRRRRAGIGQMQTRSFLPIQVQLYLPRFLVAGDRSEARGLALNQTNDSLDVTLRFTHPNGNVQTEHSPLTEWLERTYPIEASTNETDSLQFQFELNSEQAYDGEKRKLAVFPRGIEVCTGQLDMLANDSLDLTAGIDPGLGNLEVMIVQNQGQFLDRDIDHLRNYPYACNEQLIGRIIAQLATLPANANTGDWPRLLKRDFDRLAKRQLPNGGYSWWPSDSQAQLWISLHALRVFQIAKTMGKEVDGFGLLRRYLLSQIGQRPTMDEEGRISPLAAQLLLVLAESGSINDLEHRLAWVDTLAQVDDYHQLVSWRIRQLQGQEVSGQQADSLGRDYLSGGRFWEPNLEWSGRQPLDARMASTLLAYQILKDAQYDTKAHEALYYLLNRGQQDLLGRNGLESGLLVLGLYAVLNDAERVTEQEDIQLSANINSKAAGNGLVFEIAPETDDQFGVAVVRSSSDRPVLISRRQCRWVAEPQPTPNRMTIKTRWRTAAGDIPIGDEASTSGSLNQNLSLPLDETIYLDAELTIDAPADYLLLEIPIPAGAEYDNRTESGGPAEVHREYRRDRVAIFIDQLEAGSYRYSVALHGRFAGQYTQNPPRVELQYAPAVQANGSISQISLE